MYRETRGFKNIKTKMHKNKILFHAISFWQSFLAQCEEKFVNEFDTKFSLRKTKCTRNVSGLSFFINFKQLFFLPITLELLFKKKSHFSS